MGERRATAWCAHGPSQRPRATVAGDTATTRSASDPAQPPHRTYPSGSPRVEPDRPGVIKPLCPPAGTARPAAEPAGPPGLEPLHILHTPHRRPYRGRTPGGPSPGAPRHAHEHPAPRHAATP